MNTMNTPRVFRPTTNQGDQWTRTIDDDEVLIFYVGTECGMTTTLVEDRLKSAGIDMSQVRVITPEPEDGEYYDEVRARKGIGVVIGDSEESPYDIIWDKDTNQIQWVFFGGIESDTIIELDDMMCSGEDVEPLFIALVEDYKTDEIIECTEYMGIDLEEILEPLEEYPYLSEALGTLWTEIAINNSY